MANCERAYPITILLFGLVIYYWLVFWTYIRNFEPTVATMLYLVLFHLSAFLLIWSFVTTMFVHPGKPPVFWVR